MLLVMLKSAANVTGAVDAGDAAAAVPAAASVEATVLLLKMLYHICRVAGFEPKIRQTQTDVLPRS